ncbi:translocation/assembly module TamB domain-containing protein [Paludibacterium yongneupense]|uniref:translocation/assembly module TamB domain-containing protein n=1 Tax=Paludibacterium yongneupense TaxID=400061 RepID=UPI00040BAC79|nr:translocation/assembly module TamB domain-containing protein [Paludibacterium yongneupense]
MTSPPASAPGQAPAPPPHRRSWRAGCAVVLAALALAAAAGFGLSATQTGFAWTLGHLASASGGRLRLASVQGTLWRGFELGGVRLKTAAFDADIDSLAVAWQPAQLWRGRLVLDRLALGAVMLTPHARPGPAVLPGDLSLPLPVEVKRLDIGSLTVLPADLRAYALAARYRYDGRAHSFTLDRITLPSGQASARLRVADMRPFAVSGTLAANGTLDDVPVAGRLDLSGSLQNMRLGGSARGSTMNGEVRATLLPFAAATASRFQRVDLKLSGLDPQALLPHAPRARIDLALYALPTSGGRIRGAMTLVNHAPGDLAAGRLPLRLLAGAFSGAGQRWRLEEWQAQLMRGRIAAAGELSTTRLDLSATLSDIALRSVHADAPDDIVAGTLRLGGEWSAPRVQARLDGKWLSAQTDFSVLESNRLDIRRLRLGTARGAVDVEGTLQLDGNRDFRLAGRLDHANPARLHAGLPAGDINARIALQGRLSAPQSIDARLDIDRSRLSGAPLLGRVALTLAPRRLVRLEADVRLAANHLLARGAFGAPGDRMRLDLTAPSLAQFGPGFDGSLTAGVVASGTLAAPVLAGQISARRLRLPGGIGAQVLDASGELQATQKGLFRVEAVGKGLQGGGVAVERMTMTGSGSRADHRLELTARGSVGAEAFSVALGASGGLAADGTGWRGRLQRFALGGSRSLSLLAPVDLALGPQRMALLSPARLATPGGAVLVSRLERRADGTLSSAGQFAALHLAALHLPVPVRQDLVVSGQWDVRYDSMWEGEVKLLRLAGDIEWPQRALGLEALELRLNAARGMLRFSLAGRARLGRVEGTGTLGFHGWLPDARSPLTASLRLDLPDLSGLEEAAGPEFELGGRMGGSLELSGPLGMPRIGGRISGSDLILADHKTGIRLSGGDLQARLDGRRLLLDRLHFSSAGGDVLARGELGLQDDGPNARVTVGLRHFSVFDRPGRRLIVSGEGELTLVRHVFKLRGRLRADQGKIELPRLGTPALSGDVYVKGRAPTPPSALENLPFSADLTLDLGDHFHFGGQGLDTQLTGQVTLSANPGQAPAAHGQVRVLSGRYKAYGQDLDIEYGAVTFTGPLDNPHLNVRARRRLSSVGAGVEVSGTVQAPQIRLISTEALSDRDKLAWLVLGRAASSNTRDDSAMASAGALLAGSLNNQVGVFDDVGMTSRSERIQRDGRISPAEQMVTVGRQLSQEFYLGYEYGISSAQQAVKLIIQLGKNWSLVLRAGVDASAESRYTLRFD